jgi:hypothetical protein
LFLSAPTLTTFEGVFVMRFEIANTVAQALLILVPGSAGSPPANSGGSPELPIVCFRRAAENRRPAACAPRNLAAPLSRSRSH